METKLYDADGNYTKEELERLRNRWRSDVDLKLSELSIGLRKLETDMLSMKMSFDPIKDSLKTICERQKKLEERQVAEDLLHAKIAGGVNALKWMVPLVNAGVLAVLYYLHKAGIL